MKTNRFLIEDNFSWDKPIEQEILEYVRNMAQKMEHVEIAGQSEVREGAGHFSTAYRTVERHILREIKFRNSL